MSWDATMITDLRAACAGVARPGGPAHFVRMFKPRFAELVESGQKTQTIRPVPKRIPRRGDTLSLRVWTGQPYRSRQRVLLETKIDRIEVIRLDEKGIIKPPGEGSILAALGEKLCVLEGGNADRYAQADGFKDWPEMRDWFQTEHGLPFEGVALYW